MKKNVATAALAMSLSFGAAASDSLDYEVTVKNPSGQKITLRGDCDKTFSGSDYTPESLGEISDFMHAARGIKGHDHGQETPAQMKRTITFLGGLPILKGIQKKCGIAPAP